MKPAEPDYLAPYLAAARRHGDGFSSLLWASTHTQAVRFDAFTRLYDFSAKIVLDVGCGRADFLEHLIARGSAYETYYGIEAVTALAEAAEKRARRGATILRADFVAEPARMFVGADVVVFSGSLNTLRPEQFYQTLRRAYDAATEGVLFNFLAGPAIAAAQYLYWHYRKDVEVFARGLPGTVTVVDDYLEGDCTVLLRKPPLE